MSKKHTRIPTSLNSSRRLKVSPRAWSTASSINALMLGGALTVSAGIDSAHAATALPAGTLPNRPCSTSACLPFTPPNVSLGAATFNNPGSVRTNTVLTVTQTTPKAVINWNSFDIASGSTVNFVQSGSSAIALNRITGTYNYDTLAALSGMSTVQGSLSANGRVYLINQNGILFDRGSQINVAGLAVSSMNITDAVFQNLGSAGIKSQFPGIPNLTVLAAGAGISVLPNVGSVGETLTIDQGTARTATMQWDSFDISQERSVVFAQPDANSAIFNRIFDTTASSLQGRLNANGQVVLINPNGLTFANGSRVNVGSLTASTLDVSNTLINGGLLSGGTDAVYVGGAGGAISVEQDATITTPSGGRVMLLAPSVQNSGVIRTPDGQTILGAGQKVYLAASEDPGLRGLLIELDSGGTATNIGQIVAERGNITLAGLAVNQLGRVSATTSVNLNGSIRLLARDSTTIYTNGNGTTTAKQVPQLSPNVSTRLGTRTGTVTLGAGSTTEVQLDADRSSTAVDAQPFQSSSVEISGGQIAMQAAAKIVAPGGAVTLNAIADPSNPTNVANSSRIFIDSAATIDVSGTRDAQVAAERDSITVELRGSQLADYPDQRGGFLQGKTVLVDATRGTPLADVSGYVAQIGRTVSERAAAGGSIVLASEGDVITQAGSRLDVSGGQVNHLAGFIKSTLLLSQGRVYDISSPNTPKNLVVDGFADSVTISRPNGSGGFVTETIQSNYGNRGNYVTAYTEGKSAGSIKILGHQMALNGDLAGKATPGPNQRSGAKLPTGGTLVIGDASQYSTTANTNTSDYRAPDVSFVANRTALPGGFAIADPFPVAQSGTVELTSDIVGSSGFAKLGVYSNGIINVGAPLSGPAGGSITLAGGAVNVNADVRLPAGTIALSARNVGAGGSAVASHDISVAPGVSLDAVGTWVNNSATVNNQNGNEPLLTNGGAVSLRALDNVTLGAGSRVDVSAGAQLTAQGVLVNGNAGGITLAAAQNGINNQPAPQTGTVTLGAGSALSGYAAGAGGTLNLTSGTVTIGATTRALPGELRLDPVFFSGGGFSNFNVTGLDGVVVADNATISLQAATLTPRADYASQPSGSRLTDFFSKVAPLPTALSASSLSLSSSSLYLNKTVGGNTYGTQVVLGEGASINSNPGSSIAFSSATGMQVLGKVTAPAGNISLTTSEYQAGDPLDTRESVYLGAGSTLDASGVFVPKTSTNGLTQGDVRDAGRVTIAVGRGYLAAMPYETKARPGATIDVSGGAGSIQRVEPAAGSGIPTVVTQTVHGNAGTISLGATTLLFDGNLAGGAGGTAAAGQLNISTGELVLTQSGTSLPSGFQPRVAAPTGSTGKAQIAADTITAGKFDIVNLSASSKLSLTGNGGTDPVTHTLLPLTLGSSDKGRALTINTPVITLDGGNSAALAAPYVSLGGSPVGLTTPAPTTGITAGTLSIDAKWIDISGNLSLSQTSNVKLTSDADIRFGVPNLSSNNTQATSGTLKIASDLTMKADQIYPATGVNYTVKLMDTTTDPAHTLTISPGHDPKTVISAGGALTLSAAQIEQSGVVKAPFGQITFNTQRSDNTDRINLNAGSVTSVAGEYANVPYGIVQNGVSWSNFDTTTNANVAVTQAPSKQITFQGSTIDLKTDSSLPINQRKADPKVDLRGGGDIYAYEWTPGPGGSKDYLSADTINGGLPAGAFAIVPALQAKLAPYDAQYWSGAGIKMGDSVILAGGGAVAAGEYLRLPARYALLPGAYLVAPQSGNQDMLPGTVKHTDGLTIIAGRYGDTLAGSRTERWSGFALISGSEVRSHSQYTDHTGGSFFTTGSAADAGRLTFNTGGTLQFDGIAGINLAGAPSVKDGNGIETASAGRGGQLEIKAPNEIAVVSGAPAGTATRLELNADTLTQIGASSILLGGARDTVKADGTINVGADTITIANDANHILRAPEILLAANHSITIGDNSSIEAGGGTAATSGVLIMPSSGVLFAASVNKLTTPTRPAVVTGAGTGDLTIGKATITSQGSMVFDATGNTIINDAASLSAHDVILSSGRISMGSVTTGLSGLTLTNSILQQVSNAASLNLRSYKSIDFYGSFALGGALNTERPTIGNLTLDTAGIGGYNATGGGAVDATIRANSVTLINSNGVTGSPFATTAPNGSGQLRIIGSANTDGGSGRVTIGTDNSNVTGNQKTLSGFSSVTIRAEGDVKASTADRLGKGEIVLDGTGTLQTGAATLTLDAPRISGNSGSNQTFTTGSSFTITGSGGSVGAAGIGAQLTLNGSSISEGGLLDFASGNVNLNATGGNITIASGGQINVRGASIDFAGTVAHAPAGKVNLVSSGGNVQIDGAVDISSASGADAGTLVVGAPSGNLTLNGSVNGAAANGYRGGSLSADIATLSGFGALNTKLDAGVVSEQRSFRVRSGDVLLDGTATAKNIYVSADAGKITVTGLLNASGQSAGSAGGSIQLYANGDLTLKAGGELRAQGVAGVANGVMVGGHLLDTDPAKQALGTAGTLSLAAGKGGSVTVGSSGGSVIVEGASGPQAASKIDVSGGKTLDNLGTQITDSAFAGATGAGGAVTYRAPRISAPQSYTTVATAATGTTVYTLNTSLGSLNAGDVVTFTAGHASTAVTGTSSSFLNLKINGTTQKPILLNDSGAMAVNTILTNDVVQAVYDGTNFNIATIYRVPTFASNTYTLANYPNVTTTFKLGDVVAFKANAANTSGNPSIKVGTTTAQIVKQDGTALATGAIATNQLVNLMYDGSKFRVMPTVLGDVGSNVKLTSIAGNFTGALTNNVVGAASQTVEANQIYASYTTPAGGVLNGANARYLALLDVKGRLGKVGDATFHVVPGTELVSGGDFAVNADVNFFTALRPGGEAGVLTVRSAGDLNIRRSLSDGFSTTTTAGVLQSGNSWAYRLVAGANTSRPDPLALADSGGGGNVNVANNSIVRTGTGTIDIAAGAGATTDFSKGNIILGNASSVIYTAGSPTAQPANFTAPPSSVAGDFPTGGGNVTLSAASDIVGVDSRQLPNSWLYRDGELDPSNNANYLIATNGTNKSGSPAWWVKFSEFRENIGALGGGNVSIKAGRDVDNLSVVIPTTGRVSGTGPADGVVTINGGGNLRVTAGRDILSGVYYVGRGTGELTAGRSVGQSANSTINTLLALGDGGFSVTARNNVAIDGIFNPTLLPQTANNLAVQTSLRSVFSTYAAGSSASLNALTGDLNLQSHSTAFLKSWQQGCTPTPTCLLKFDATITDEALFSLYPGTLNAIAMQGNISAPNALTLAPSAQGQFNMLAGSNVRVADILMSDADPSLMRSPAKPYSTPELAGELGIGGGNQPHASTPVHQNDNSGPVRIVALNGAVEPLAGEDTVTLRFPKPAEIFAGTNVSGLSLYMQNLHDTDVSRVTAVADVQGKEIRGNDGKLSTNNNNISVGGPGTLIVQAGGNVDLANSTGILSRGNLLNPALPAQGAGIVVIAGVKDAPAYDTFAAKYLDPSQPLVRQCVADCNAPLNESQSRTLTDGEQSRLNTLKSASATATYQTRSYSTELKTFLGASATGLSDTAAYVAFTALPADQRAAFVRQIFATELREAGRGVVSGGTDSYLRGYAAIGTLFPRSDYRGDIKMYYSQIKTERGGSIDLMAPGGLVNAGLASAPKDLTKSASELGIVTALGGNIDAMVHDDFLVNQSRVFTLGGGGISIWSSEGGIDAGKGSKTATLASPPVVTVDSSGNVTTTLLGAASGSGIGVLLTNPGAKPDLVDLIAPIGTVDAGDAGIRASGGVFIAAAVLLNSANIGAPSLSVGGGATVAVSAPSAGVGGASSGAAASSVAQQAAQQMSNAAQGNANQRLPSIIIIDVLGLGEN